MQDAHEKQLRAHFTGQFVERASSEHRQSRARLGVGPTAPGRYQILFITEGKANGLTFSRQVLQESAPLWEGATVFVDHSFWGTQSVRDLGGVLSNAAWTEEFAGLTAELTPAGPSKEIIREAADITMRDGSTPNIGFSADVIFTCRRRQQRDQHPPAYSVDLVVDPAFATKFIRTSTKARSAYPSVPMDCERSEPSGGQPERPALSDSEGSVRRGATSSTTLKGADAEPITRTDGRRSTPPSARPD